MEGAPKIPSPENKKKAQEISAKAANMLGVIVGGAIAAANPMQKAMNPLEQVHKVDMVGPTRARDYEPMVEKYETEKLVIQAPTPEQIAKILETKKEKQ